MEIEQVKMNSRRALRGMRMRSDALWGLSGRKALSQSPTEQARQFYESTFLLELRLILWYNLEVSEETKP